MTKRHVLTPDRWVSVDAGLVRDLDGNQLGAVQTYSVNHVKGWTYTRGNDEQRVGIYDRRDAAIAALVADPSCPTPGPNRYDRPAR